MSSTFFSECYSSLLHERDKIEKNPILTEMIKNSILQNQLINELQSNSALTRDRSTVGQADDKLVKELSDKIQPLQEQLFKEKQTNTQLAR